MQVSPQHHQRAKVVMHHFAVVGMEKESGKVVERGKSVWNLVHRCSEDDQSYHPLDAVDQTLGMPTGMSCKFAFEVASIVVRAQGALKVDDKVRVEAK